MSLVNLFPKRIGLLFDWQQLKGIYFHPLFLAVITIFKSLFISIRECVFLHCDTNFIIRMLATVISASQIIFCKPLTCNSNMFACLLLSFLLTSFIWPSLMEAKRYWSANTGKYLCFKFHRRQLSRKLYFIWLLTSLLTTGIIPPKFVHTRRPHTRIFVCFSYILCILRFLSYV